ncbi:hypothetical protein WJX77_003915 [Trebouxia sp. C0004]
MLLPRCGKYRIRESLDSRPNSKVFLGVDEESGRVTDVKLEESPSRSPSLLYESKLFKLINGKGLRPTLLYYGVQCHGSQYYSFMVLEQLGPSLADLLKSCGGTFTIATTLKLAIQLLTETERFHECCFVHRDLKPDNVLA